MVKRKQTKKESVETQPEQNEKDMIQIQRGNTDILTVKFLSAILAELQKLNKTLGK